MSQPFNRFSLTARPPQRMRSQTRLRVKPGRARARRPQAGHRCGSATASGSDLGVAVGQPDRQHYETARQIASKGVWLRAPPGDALRASRKVPWRPSRYASRALLQLQPVRSTVSSTVPRLTSPPSPKTPRQVRWLRSSRGVFAQSRQTRAFTGGDRAGQTHRRRCARRHLPSFAGALPVTLARRRPKFRARRACSSRITRFARSRRCQAGRCGSPGVVPRQSRPSGEGATSRFTG